MKLMLFAAQTCTFLLVGASGVQAASLEELLSQQTVEKIQPLVIAGQGVAAGAGPSVCALLGFTRMVSYESEPCTSGERVNLVASMGGAARFSENGRCNLWGGHKLKSLTCAR